MSRTEHPARTHEEPDRSGVTTRRGFLLAALAAGTSAAIATVLPSAFSAEDPTDDPADPFDEAAESDAMQNFRQQQTQRRVPETMAPREACALLLRALAAYLPPLTQPTTTIEERARCVVGIDDALVPLRAAFVASIRRHPALTARDFAEELAGILGKNRCTIRTAPTATLLQWRAMGTQCTFELCDTDAIVLDRGNNWKPAARGALAPLSPAEVQCLQRNPNRTPQMTLKVFFPSAQGRNDSAVQLERAWE